MKRFGIILVIGLFLTLAATVCLYLDIMVYAEKPGGTLDVVKQVVVQPRQRFKNLAEDLRRAGIIRYPHKFELFARIRGMDKNIKAGEYTLSPSLTPAKILEILVAGKVRLYKFTVPEGYNLKQIAALVARAGYATESDFMKLATDPARVRESGIDAPTFEGYLFPDTYYFPKEVTPEKIIATMVERFREVFKPEWEQQARALGLSVHQVVTLASIIEKETGVPEERPIISSVFHNRLKRKIRLESDPTVIYGIEEYDGNITRKHLTTPTPYNTYTINGLPPGPIAGAGAKSIEAALYPADTDFLYFVAKKNQTHQFSTNIKDHNRAVQKYQLRRLRK